MKVREVTLEREYLIRLERGEDVLATLTDFCKRRGIKSGSFRAIGAVEHSSIGYYDLSTKEYGKKEYEEAREVASMTGNIAGVDGAPFIHAHAVLSGMEAGRENEPIGGHVFAMKVAVTLEIHLVAFNEAISRTLDNDIGLKLLDL